MTSFVKNTSSAALLQARRPADEHDADGSQRSPDPTYQGVTPAVLTSPAQAMPAIAPTRGCSETLVDLVPLTGRPSDASGQTVAPFSVLSCTNGVSDYSILTAGSFESAKILTPGVDDMIHTLGVISQKMASAASTVERSQADAAPKHPPQHDADPAEISNRVSAIRTRHQLAVQQLTPAQSGLGFTLRLFR